MLAPELKASINKLWDRFWAGGIANPLTAIEQISYLIFMKRLEDLDNLQQKRAQSRGEKYDSVFKGHDNCRWSHWKNFSAEQMMIHVRDVVFPFIKLMQDALFLIPKPSLLQEAVSIIDELSITSRNQDVQGDIYEYLLSELNQAGKAGQFRTPRHIIRMMVKLVDPKLGEKVCDPACGTAGFLIGAYEHVLETNTSKDIIKFDKEGGHPHNLVADKITDKKHWELLKRNTFYGFDFDATMVRIASMNMILHGIEHPNIKYADTLAKSFQQKPEYDVILANPPFTGSIDTSDIHDALKLKTSKTELLFLELFHNLLNIGGRAAVIVPNGVLFGSSTAHKQVRQLLLEKCRLDAVISMPAGVFQPYSGVGTAVLVFTKGDKTDSVWFYDMQADGYSLDQKRDFIDGKGDIPDIIEKFPERKKSKQSIVVPFSEIKKNDYNLSISQYKKIEHEKVEYEKPEKLLDKILKIEEEITSELKELRKMMR
jgi:type I restriction enzyme M protein